MGMGMGMGGLPGPPALPPGFDLSSLGDLSALAGLPGGIPGLGLGLPPMPGFDPLTTRIVVLENAVRGGGGYNGGGVWLCGWVGYCWRTRRGLGAEEGGRGRVWPCGWVG